MSESPPLLFSPTEFEKAFAAEHGHMFTRVSPAALDSPAMAATSTQTAALLNLPPAALTDADFWSGNWQSNQLGQTQPSPIAQVYSGHQFGVWAGQLGDGRAMSLGTIQDIDGVKQEVQFKGAGLTPYSRGADGKAVLRSSVREFLCSEAMVGLGIPTTRVLTLANTQSPVIRETVESAAVVTRVAPSFIRFGHFEHYFYNDKPQQLRALAEFVMTHHYPECLTASNPFAALLQAIVARSAQLVAKWQAVGFCHGVLNTDNMSILGLTIDYGPFGFLDQFDPAHICNHSDHSGRYSYQNQPSIVQWNCYALGQAFVSLIGSVDQTKQVLSTFKAEFETAMKSLWQRKLGLTQRQANDDSLVDSMFELMQRNQVDWTIWFRSLSHVTSLNTAQNPCPPLRDQCLDRTDCDQWVTDYAHRLTTEPQPDALRKKNMDAVNPRFVLRNYLAQAAIDKANQQDYSEISRLQQILARPYDEQPQFAQYAAQPPDWANKIEVSCSS